MTVRPTTIPVAMRTAAPNTASTAQAGVPGGLEPETECLPLIPEAECLPLIPETECLPFIPETDVLTTIRSRASPMPPGRLSES